MPCSNSGFGRWCGEQDGSLKPFRSVGVEDPEADLTIPKVNFFVDSELVGARVLEFQFETKSWLHSISTQGKEEKYQRLTFMKGEEILAIP